MTVGFDEAVAKYGQPLGLTCTLESIDFPPLSKRPHGEVCMAIRRKNGRFLLQTKASYPKSVMRLPSGGINPDEDLETALLREIWEETNLEVEVKAFIAQVSYSDGSETSPFRTNLFLSQELSGEMANNDPTENISDWIEVEAEKLTHYAAYLQAIIPTWRHWGRFRSFSMAALSDFCLGENRRL